MYIGWNAMSSIATAIGSLVTAIGVAFVGVQIRITKKHAQAKFEDSMDQQYRILSMGIPVDVLMGQEKEVRELIYNYLDLSNEQIYLRAKECISSLTWKS